jgi:predicted MPP superfamily phosphohydrolase
MRRINPLPVIVFLLFFYFVESYVFTGVKTLSRDLERNDIVYWSYWLFSGGILLTLLYAISGIIRSRQFTPFSKIVFNAFLAVLVSKLAFVVVLLGEDVYRLLSAAVHFLRNAGSDPDVQLWQERNKYVSLLGLLFSGFILFSFIYGILRGKYRYRVRRETLYFDDLPESFDGFTITQISDIHAGSFDNAAAVQKGVDLVMEQGSDLFVFTGDLVNNLAGEIEPWLEHFKQIRAPFGQYSILGNHDYGDYIQWKSPHEKAANLAALKQHHNALGYRLLLDEHVYLEKNGERIVLAGVENWGLGFGERGKLQHALHGTQKNDFKVLLSHDPSHWDAQVKNNESKIQLTLSGHTHGMQFGVELFGFKWSPVKYRYRNWAGLAMENNSMLYVNRGFGFIGFSGRVGIWPEITVLELRKKK